MIMDTTNGDALIEVIDILIKALEQTTPPSQVKEVSGLTLELLYMMKNNPKYITSVLAIASNLCIQHPATGAMFCLRLLRNT